ncbi:MAG TPA: peptidylprolyl isomerase [Anaerohalosphaeraceae bacterium]|nr:peptidylprolyl isomerase [Anaerohalosphaeraceae bacterium]HRT50556.1 peptidylprolyl isomerase [Anaerohalosphaeraceae bacterium]HRT86504.1 peptidylprolyl isomerase [Anaerohalosphaeraceae bacterium]
MTLYVNGEAVDGQRIIDEANKLRPLHDATFADMPQDEREQQLMEWSRENVVEAVLLRQAALRDVGPVEDETVEATLNQMIEQSGGAEQFYARMGLPADQRRRIKEDIAERICLERLIRRITSKVAEPTEKEIRKYYDKNAERFTIPEMVRAAHIVKHLKPIDDPGQFRSEMEAIRSQIGDNTDFGALAAKLSDCPENGGDLGFFARGQMVQEFEDVVFGLRPGQVSGVFQTEFGFHIAKVLDRKPPVPCPVEEVRPVIVRELVEQARQKAIEKFVDAEKEKATIEEREA